MGDDRINGSTRGKLMMAFCFKSTLVLGFRLVLVFSWLVGLPLAAAADHAAKLDNANQARRDDLLRSELWRKTMTDVDRWYAAHPIYDQKQIDDIKKQTSRRVETMSADELEEFRLDLEAKLATLQSPEGDDTLKWVAATQAAAAPTYRKKMDIQYPDVAGLSAVQLRGQLDVLAQKRSAAQHQAVAQERAREVRLEVMRAEQQRQYGERERALDRGIASFGRAGYPTTYGPTQQRRYPQVVSRGYGFGFGFGLGFGFW